MYHFHLFQIMMEEKFSFFQKTNLEGKNLPTRNYWNDFIKIKSWLKMPMIKFCLLKNPTTIWDLVSLIKKGPFPQTVFPSIWDTIVQSSNLFFQPKQCVQQIIDAETLLKVVSKIVEDIPNICLSKFKVIYCNSIVYCSDPDWKHFQ